MSASQYRGQLDRKRKQRIEADKSNDQNLWMALGGWAWWSAPSRG